MDTNLSLKSIFVSKKDELSRKLETLSLPKDSRLVQSIVSDYLNDLFENDGLFRQNLTESEDYLLQASLKLLQAQQGMADEFAKAAVGKECDAPTGSTKAPASPVAPYLSAVGAGAGAIVGTLVGKWAAIAGAIAGAALVVYGTVRTKGASPVKPAEREAVPPTPIDADVFCSIVERICDGIDGIIDTYRVQLKRISNVYEQRERPTLLNTYSTLMEQVANVISISKAGGEIPAQLRSAISVMEESLGNYDLKFENGRIVSE